MVVQQDRRQAWRAKMQFFIGLASP